jgi:hypothetical protein
LRDAQAPPPPLPAGRLLRVARPRRWVLNPWHPGGRPRLLHGQLPRHPMAPRMPPIGLVGLSLLLLQANTSVHEPLTAPAYSHAGVYARQRAPAGQTFSPQRSMARYKTPPLHGRLSFLGGLLPRRVTTSTTRLGPARQHRPPTQPQERRVDADASRRPLKINGGYTGRHVSRPTRKTTAARQTRFSPTRPSGFERSLAAHASTSGLRKESSVPLPSHRARPGLFTRAPQRFSHTD